MACFEHTKDERAAVVAALSRIGVEVEESVVEGLLDHLKMVIEKNKTLNLTRIDSIEDGIALHIADSLSVLPEFDSTEGQFIDIGTGGGFPGIPLSIATGREGSLLDSVKKKATAVEDFVEQLGMSDRISVYGMRSEELALNRPNAYSVVVARAVCALPSLLELSAPLLKIGGSLIAMKAKESTEDMNAVSKACKILGFEKVSQRSFYIDDEFERTVYMFNKVDESTVKLPRRPGMAQKKPYGSK